eukprot:234101_1
MSSFQQFKNKTKNQLGSTANEDNEGLLVAPPASGKYCISCRFQLPGNAQFCSQCGKNQNDVLVRGEGYQPPAAAPQANPNQIIVIEHKVQPKTVLPAGVHKCQQSFCGRHTTLRCHQCSTWRCQSHLVTVKGNCNTYPMLCDDCRTARNCRQLLLVAVLIVILILVFVVSGAVGD